VTLHNRSLEGDISFHFTLQPLVFLRLLTWGSLAPSPFSFAALRSRGFPTAKAKKTTGASVKLFKEISPARERLPSVPPAAGAVCLLQGFDRGPDCTASGKGNELALKPGKR